ncbi:hypothetical protein Caci_5528 [Catenulispora acidiphila DSM 44928]|uniref:Uncharacterized protein n=1 Tax=Catenulispora acidiphila (strain DSM 44928 / JCM 14897 / NBRC 102108 / NRRL B-24433 / ID139908) TaxID=479433 RepID=C7QAR4_CATAD|nr:DUF6191 domain-containing protein [Catenulispora acidiphila]ACU74387.1 hypothetical protein Caci_5528 [Catenulispora acidiphila DSM 44928]
MSVFFDMFAPSRRHLEEERNRLEWTRDEEGEGDPHRGPIDLDSGVVSIKTAGPDPDPNLEPDPEPTETPQVSETPQAGAAPQVTKPAASGTPRSEP